MNARFHPSSGDVFFLSLAFPDPVPPISSLPMTFTTEPDECPFCGAELAANAIRCRRCGACEEYGWNSVENHVNGLGGDFGDDDYGEDDFDYDDFVAREFPDHAKNSGQKSGLSMTARLVILALVVSLILTFVFH